MSKPDNTQPDHIVDMHEMVTDTNQASEDELELIVARISAGIGGFGKLTCGTRYDGISEEAGTELLKAYIRTEKLKQKTVSENEKIREMLNDPEVIGKAVKGAIKAQRKMAGLESKEL